MDKTLDTLKENWKKYSLEDDFSRMPMKPFNESLYRFISERVDDENKVKSSLEMYSKILDNFNKAALITAHDFNLLNFNSVVGYAFGLMFYKNTRGMFFTEIDIPSQKIKDMPCIVVGDNMYDDRDIQNPIQFWINNKEYIVHEIVHHKDTKRTKLLIPSNTSDKDYYNHPFEFNAYFIQAASEIYSTVDNLKKIGKNESMFTSAFGSTNREFVDIFWKMIGKNQPKLKKSLNKKYLFKWNKRIYQLYDELKKYFNK
jgi:hypothetical protein